jgi:copper chaperone CopZ
MMCGGCVSRVRRVLEGHEAVTTASVNLATETALVRVVIADTQAQKGHERALHAISCELAAVRFFLHAFVAAAPASCAVSCF